MKLLNLGCGKRYHPIWTNLDFISAGKEVTAHNLLNGIPFEDNSFDVVYHSHVLEHFSKADGKSFIIECYRVLKLNGIIRIAVPDLERITKEYLRNLELALQGNEKAKNDYEWIKLEIYDQMVRNESGGDMAKYLFQKDIPNEEYVYDRIGEEGRNLRKCCLESIINLQPENDIPFKNNKINDVVKSIVAKSKLRFKKIFFGNEIRNLEKCQREAAIGKFRLSGEIHQCMYDRYSLTKLLVETGFSQPEVKDAFTSKIPNWNSYELEAKNGTVYKPDSLFIEAVK